MRLQENDFASLIKKKQFPLEIPLDTAECGKSHFNVLIQEMDLKESMLIESPVRIKVQSMDLL